MGREVNQAWDPLQFVSLTRAIRKGQLHNRRRWERREAPTTKRDPERMHFHPKRT